MTDAFFKRVVMPNIDFVQFIALYRRFDYVKCIYFIISEGVFLL